MYVTYSPIVKKRKRKSIKQTGKNVSRSISIKGIGVFYVLFLYFQINYKLFLNKKMKKKRFTHIAARSCSSIIPPHYYSTNVFWPYSCWWTFGLFLVFCFLFFTIMAFSWEHSCMFSEVSEKFLLVIYPEGKLNYKIYEMFTAL